MYSYYCTLQDCLLTHYHAAKHFVFGHLYVQPHDKMGERPWLNLGQQVTEVLLHRT